MNIQLSREQRGQMLQMFVDGRSNTYIASVLNRSESIIRGHRGKFLQTGNMDYRPGRGRKRKTTEQEDRIILNDVRSDGYVTANDILERNTFLHVSKRTIHSRIKESGEFANMLQVRKPYLSQKQKRRRLD